MAIDRKKIRREDRLARLQRAAQSTLPVLSESADQRVWRRARARFVEQAARRPVRIPVPLPAVACAAVCLAAVAGTFAVRALYAPQPALVLRVAGEGTRTARGRMRPLAGGDRLGPGAVVGVPGGAVADLTDHAGSLRLRLAGGSLEVVATSPRRGERAFELRLKDGDVLVQTLEPFRGSALRITTPHLAAAVRGTAFRVATDPASGTRVEVESGTVELTTGAAHSPVVLRAGETATVGNDALVRTAAIGPAGRALIRQALASLAAPSMILGVADYFMPTDSIVPEVGLALGWDPDRAARVVDCDVTPRRSLPLRLVRGTGHTRQFLADLDAAAAMQMEASAASDAAYRRRLYLDAADILEGIVDTRPDPARDAPILLYAAHLQSRGAGGHLRALATLARAHAAADTTLLAPVVLMSQALLLEDRLDRPADARPLYRDIIERYPDAPEAILARLRVGDAG